MLILPLNNSIFTSLHEKAAYDELNEFSSTDKNDNLLKGIRVTGESKQLKDDVVHQAIEEAVTSSAPDYNENDNKPPGRFEQSVLSNTGKKEQQRGNTCDDFITKTSIIQLYSDLQTLSFYF